VPSQPDAILRRRLDLRGQVQGVGFRPFVYRLAVEHALAGHVANNTNGAVIEIEGPADRVAAFEHDLVHRLPPLARIAEMQTADLAASGEQGFHIRHSQADADRRPDVTPDAATCADCLAELLDPRDRRAGYPFINCTNCGPRYSIIRTVPYDRPATTMAVFEMCGPCAREYGDPLDRRFHAQPNACAVCGPRLRLCRLVGTETQPIPGDAVARTAALLRDGSIVAIKGIGGYHLVCRADRQEVVERLRERKLRDGKPLAVMVPNVDAARRMCRLSPADVTALASPAAPIVLAPQAAEHGLAPAVAPGCATFGVMLPYAPLHHLLFAAGLGPLVMTSANLAGQPLTYRDEDALAELGTVADAFLMHDREIFRPIDDSVVFTFAERTIPVRRARGYAPQPLRPAAFAAGGALATVRDRRILAVGAELKSTVCLLGEGQAILSEHLGDLTHPETYRHFVRAIDRLRELFDFTPDVVVHDEHPAYLSTHYAQGMNVPAIAVQHHHAHIAAVMAEHDTPGPVIGLSCDGTGYGTDGAVWGGEVLYCHRGAFERVDHLEYFPLLGGDAAAIETWRPAAALLVQAFGDAWLQHWPADADPPPTPHLIEQQLRAGLNAPPTSSLGRVFDAASFLLGLCQRNRHEAEAAMTLEAAADEHIGPAAPYPCATPSADGQTRLSPSAIIRALVLAREAGESATLNAARFHETIARLFADAAQRAARQRHVRTFALSGGCFANRRLLARIVEILAANGGDVLYHQQVPSGDGGLALGQAWIAAWKLADRSASPAATES
jgi:hydrogenase maturation protein HypF